MSRTRAVEPWALEPLQRFVGESGARLALLTTPAGQVIAQHGFTRAVDVMSAAALGAAIAASTAAIIRMLAEPKFRALAHQGREHGIHLASLETPRGREGFGYDPIFFHPPSGVTFAEMPAATKNRVSHRARNRADRRDAVERFHPDPRSRRNPPVRRLQPHASGVRGGQTNRAAGVGSQRAEAHAGRHGCG